MDPELSPMPHEPDTHIRIKWRGVEMHFRACVTAAANFLERWPHSHAPTADAAEIGDGFLPARRLPCEELWI
ncbi:hypothetical protein [Nocardia carnea]|uniref:hypothetical protein n=1 Tax=Nocardia carnea TaxID=37328 RepID=UPI00245649FF|nr:hypothetical protein [Nocardia carnea]